MEDWVASPWNTASPTGHNANKPKLKPELERRAAREGNESIRQAGVGGECKGRIGVGHLLCHMPVNSFKLSASHSHNLLNQNTRRRSLDRATLYLRASYLSEIEFRRPEKPRR